MSKTKMTDIIIVALISGVVAVLTSFMGISGTIIGAVVTSFVAEFLKKFFKDPLMTGIEQDNVQLPKKTAKEKFKKVNNYEYAKKYQDNDDSSYITTKILFLFPLVIILIIELIHFLGAMGIIPYDIFLNLENITNWTLFRTIGYALIIMGLYPLFSGKIKSTHGILLIVIGIIELIIGYADVNVHASIIYSLFESVKEYVNIAIIACILYTILRVPDEVDKNTKNKSDKVNTHRFNNYTEYDDEEDMIY
ncbi:MAG: hypothetical protein BZ137_04110 [Methanosphaera sp. rholeuAM130]|nr:hypothetical protein [Methanosphaera sp.]RAP54091.1 MAG: hypothetical protein BZ137_04110 [Methanosphaera sp. rholeuAM130]